MKKNSDMTPEIEELFTDAQLKFMDDDFEGAIELFSAVIEKDTMNVKAYQGRAIAFLRSDKKDEALADIEQAINIAPENPRLHYHKGGILFNTERYDEAIEALTRAIEIRPDYGPAYLIRSEVLDRIGEHDAATIDFSKAMDLRNMETRNDKVVDY